MQKELTISEVAERAWTIEKIIRELHPDKEAEFMTLMKLMEEVGELTEVVLRAKGRQSPHKTALTKEQAAEEAGKEITDIIIALAILSKYLGADLNSAVEKKLSDHESRWKREKEKKIHKAEWKIEKEKIKAEKI